MKQKNTILIFVISVILSCIILCFFITGYYSIDTERIYVQGYIDYATKDAYIRDGRLFSALLFVMIGLINPSIKTMYIINILISILILSVGVILIYGIIAKYKRLDKLKNKTIAFILSYMYIFNFFIVDVLKYIDSFVISTSIILFVLAIKNIIIEKKTKIGFLLTLLGVICYQGTIPVYIATAILVTLLENKKIDKEFFKKILPCAICIFIAALMSVVIVNLVPIITEMQMTDRIDDLDYLNNIKKNIAKLNEMLLYSFYMFPPYVWIGIAVFLIGTSIGYSIKNKKYDFWVNIIWLFMFYIFSCFIFLPIIQFDITPRVVLVIAQSITAILLFSYCTNFENEKINIYEKIIVAVIVLYFIITLFSILKSTFEFKLANILDQEFSKKVENEIVRLEEQGIVINKIGIKYTGNGNNMQKYSKLVRKESMYIAGLYTFTLQEFYTGRGITRVQDFTKELEGKYFKNPSEEEVQFKSIDDVLYILIDL